MSEGGAVGGGHERGGRQAMRQGGMGVDGRMAPETRHNVTSHVIMSRHTASITKWTPASLAGRAVADAKQGQNTEQKELKQNKTKQNKTQ